MLERSKLRCDKRADERSDAVDGVQNRHLFHHVGQVGDKSIGLRILQTKTGTVENLSDAEERKWRRPGLKAVGEGLEGAADADDRPKAELLRDPDVDEGGDHEADKVEDKDERDHGIGDLRYQVKGQL